MKCQKCGLSNPRDSKFRNMVRRVIPFSRNASRCKTIENLALRSWGKALIHKDPKKGLDLLRKSVSIARKKKMKFELSISLYELAHMLYTQEKRRDARKYCTECELIFSKAGAKYWIDKAQQLKKQLR
jgi:hypothetical protein